MYETIKTLMPYFRSIRDLTNEISLDIIVPVTWKLADLPNIRTQDKSETLSLISIISTPTKEGYDEVVSIAKKIIRFNLEEEEKEKLFQLKIQELRDLFKNESLDKLKEIILVENNVEEKPTNTPRGRKKQADNTGDGMADEGNGEGPSPD